MREPASGREYALLKIETSSGVTGWGEARAIAGGEVAQARGVLRGRQATEYNPLHAQLASLPNLQAAVNMALLDIVGQAAKAPVYQALGGPTRYRARAMAPLAGADDAALAASMKRAQGAGFHAFLLPAAPGERNSGQAFVLANRKRMEGLRTAAGEDADFAIDCGSGLTPGDAASLSDALEPMHPLWLDEPCELTNLESIRKVASERVTPVGFGRTVTRSAEFQDLLREDLIDVFRPDLARNGITQIRKFAALAEANYIAVAPYHDGGPVGTAAAMHLAASLPNFFIQQFPFPQADADRRFRAQLAGAELETVTDGYLALPTAPGLGVKIDASLLGKEVA
ncbi:MAG TPA: mandelate racemase/muconate lactonizing enzyme family protein [Bryobacteraceae bacterium]|nr:mandelate racemase/muconate lactonizing enzyme family protein [Bryobacteraceae bacterium]